MAGTPPAIRITLLEAPPAAGAEPATLHRALRPDVAFPFVAIARARSRETAGLYEVAREHGDPDVAGGVVRIELFAAAGEEERVIAAWEHAREELTGRRGYLGARLYRSQGAAEFALVDVARWSSPLMVARAQLPSLPLASEAALYLVAEPISRGA